MHFFDTVSLSLSLSRSRSLQPYANVVLQRLNSLGESYSGTKLKERGREEGILMFEVVGVGKGFGMGIWKKSNPHSCVLDFSLSFVECVMTMCATFNNNALFNCACSYTSFIWG